MRINTSMIWFDCGDTFGIQAPWGNTYFYASCSTQVNWVRNCPDSYRFGFNGQEKDNEVKGAGNSLDFGARIYDSRLGRWMSRDKLEYNFAYWSPYNFVGNTPLSFIDPDGNKRTITITYKFPDGSQTKISLIDDGLICRQVAVPSSIGGVSTHNTTYYYDWYDYSQTIVFELDEHGKIVNTIKSEPTFEKKRVRTWYNMEWFAKALVDDGPFEMWGGVMWWSVNGKGEESKKTFRLVSYESVDQLLNNLTNLKDVAGKVTNTKDRIERLKKALELGKSTWEELDKAMNTPEPSVVGKDKDNTTFHHPYLEPGPRGTKQGRNKDTIIHNKDVQEYKKKNPGATPKE